MPYFLIERTFATQIEENRQAAAGINLINAEEGIEWLISFLSADRKKTYCLYQAPSAEAIQEAARRAGLPADLIIEVGEMRRNGELGPLLPERFALTDQTQS